jgi:hypothetical protein
MKQERHADVVLVSWGRVGLSAENPFKDFALLFSANDIRLLG